ncbi:MAG: leucine-rich repeat domain-containing protein, partial [Aphanocapsa feldmannii 288cV]
MDLVLTPSSLTLAKGGSGSYTVALVSAPTAAVVMVTVSTGSDVTVDTDSAVNGNQNTLTFTIANWITPQTVQVSLGQDVDDTVTLSHKVSGGNYDSVTANLRVNVTDDQAAALVLTPSSLTLAEGGSGSYTVALNSQPTAAVTVSVSPGSGVTVDTDDDTKGNQSTLTFTTRNWNKQQTVEVSAGQDTDAVNDTVTLAHSASGGDYDSVTANLRVNVTDDEAAALVFTPSSLTLVGGGSGSYTVALNSAPTTAVMVIVSAGPGVTVDTDAAANGNQHALSFTTANWSTPQTVEMNVGPDVDDTVTLTHTASGGNYGSVTANLRVNVQNICERFDALSSNRKACDLSSKEISTLSPGDFDGLPNLQYISLHSNALSSLPEDSFAGLSDLRTLYLFGNDLSNLPENIFAGLSNLG